MRQDRRLDRPPHPLNRLARERLVRDLLVREPGRIDLVSLAPAPPPVPRPRLTEVAPCAALGYDGEGRVVVVVCSVGIDLDLVPWAADARLALAAPADRLLLVLPRRDAHPVTRALAEQLRHPAELVPLDL